MSISGALLVLGGIVALLLPSLPLARTPTASRRTTMLRDGILLLRIRAYRQISIAAAQLWAGRIDGAFLGPAGPGACVMQATLLAWQRPTATNRLAMRT
jgi:hypothetical protein